MVFAKKFLGDTASILSSISIEEVENVVRVIKITRDRGGRIFFAGSGGGAGHASHATCDFRKLCDIESYCVTDNVSELTAQVNDTSWEMSYSNWLRTSRLSSKDCLFVFSVGGGSTVPVVSANLVAAIGLATGVGAFVVGIVGRDGGELRRAADASVLIPTVDRSLITPQVEGIQALLWHLIVSHPDLALSETRWENLDNASSR